MRFSSTPALALVSLCLSLLTGCTDAYLPEVSASPQSLLVVDGFLNSQGVSTIKLSRTFAIASKGAQPVETKASVYVEEDAGPRFLLAEGSVKGTYTSAPLLLNPAKQYRLHLTTQGGQEYASDFVPVKTTPPIDEVNWRIQDGKLNISVSTHDETNSSRYYRWEYAETWEITPPYRPNYEYVNHKMREIVDFFPTLCWGNSHSSVVSIFKTTSLSADVVSDFRLRQLPLTSELLNTRYSILVQQHALTKEEYAYWELLRKNTESLGGLFDPQPAQLTGNVHNLTRPDEVALGYVSAHSRSEKRFFIARQELPQNLNLLNGYEDCLPPDTVYIDRPAPVKYPAEVLEANFNPGSGNLPIDALYNLSGILIGYTAKKRDCIDCRTRGTSVRPSFW